MSNAEKAAILVAKYGPEVVLEAFTPRDCALDDLSEQVQCLLAELGVEDWGHYSEHGALILDHAALIAARQQERIRFWTLVRRFCNDHRLLDDIITPKEDRRDSASR